MGFFLWNTFLYLKRLPYRRTRLAKVALSRVACVWDRWFHHPGPAGWAGVASERAEMGGSIGEGGATHSIPLAA